LIRATTRPREKVEVARVALLAAWGQHDVWTDGEQQEAIPRHSEINEKLARTILRRAQKRK
jgi:mRNA interferase HicA